MGTTAHATCCAQDDNSTLEELGDRRDVHQVFFGLSDVKKTKLRPVCPCISPQSNPMLYWSVVPTLAKNARMGQPPQRLTLIDPGMF